MPIPVGYDAYLSTAFGDYMTPPPANKQVPHHDTVIADMDKSYTEYKGEYGWLRKKYYFFMWSFSLGGGAEKILSTIVSIWIQKSMILIFLKWSTLTRDTNLFPSM